MEKIDVFDGQYFFLSNFYPAKVEFGGLTYLSSEAAFQAQKCPERAKEFINLNPSEAKRLGRKVKLRDGWDNAKGFVMEAICKRKFLQNPDLLEKLLATGDAELIEGNTWNDKYWGVCNGEGENNLGIILMRLRRHFAVSRELAVSGKCRYWDDCMTCARNNDCFNF